MLPLRVSVAVVTVVVGAVELPLLLLRLMVVIISFVVVVIRSSLSRVSLKHGRVLKSSSYLRLQTQ